VATVAGVRLTEVHVPVFPLERFIPLIGEEQGNELMERAARAREVLEGRTVWNINTTATGGGVAEMLQTLLGYSRGAGVDARWLVMAGDLEFFSLTKRMHNFFHGSPGDGGHLGDAEREHYDEVAAANGQELAAMVRPGDVVLVHDPQPAGLVPVVKSCGASVVWRSHIGIDDSNRYTEAAWSFVRPYIEQADVCVFSRQAYVPGWLERPVRIIAPSIDPFAVKNAELPPENVRAILTHVGLIRGEPEVTPTFHRLDGSPARVDHVADIVRAGPPPAPDVPLVIQVSRWDRLKDMKGVMLGFAEELDGTTPAQLALIGPNVSGVADDPEGAEVLQECIDAWQQLPHSARAHIALVCLPMHDTEENAAIVNAAQRHAAIVVQKSLAEGFGLTVSEAMWKARPVVGSCVGGIQDQVDDSCGILLEDPKDLAAFGAALRRLLDDPAMAHDMGQAARRRAIEHFISTRHLSQYVELMTQLVNGDFE
jgi:trehalose synthase